MRVAVPSFSGSYSYKPSPTGPSSGYMDSISRALVAVRCEPFVVTPGSKIDLTVSGVVFPGGSDISSQMYGEGNKGQWVGELDKFQLKWAYDAMIHGIPVLGICRGLQLMNVASGGSLVHHVDNHMGSFSPKTGESGHPIHVTTKSKLRRYFGTRMQVNTRHHQCAKVVGRGFQITGWAEDGVPELLESNLGPFHVGCQFHPEDMTHMPQVRDLWCAFSSACARYTLLKRDKEGMREYRNKIRKAFGEFDRPWEN